MNEIATHLPGREKRLRLFACECAERALRRWQESDREPDQRNFEVIRKVRAVANGFAPISELKAARELSDQSCKEFIKNEHGSKDMVGMSGDDIAVAVREQLSWYGALNAVSATCNPDYEDAAEYAAREGRREARRVGDEQREIAWQEERLEKLRIIPRAKDE